MEILINVLRHRVFDVAHLPKQRHCMVKKCHFSCSISNKRSFQFQQHGVESVLILLLTSLKKGHMSWKRSILPFFGISHHICLCHDFQVIGLTKRMTQSFWYWKDLLIDILHDLYMTDFCLSQKWLPSYSTHYK